MLIYGHSFLLAIYSELGPPGSGARLFVPAPEFGLGWGSRVFGFRWARSSTKCCVAAWAYVRLDMSELQRRPLSSKVAGDAGGNQRQSGAAALTAGTRFSAVNLLLAPRTCFHSINRTDGSAACLGYARCCGVRSSLVEWTFTVAEALSASFSLRSRCFGIFNAPSFHINHDDRSLHRIGRFCFCSGESRG